MEKKEDVQDPRLSSRARGRAPSTSSGIGPGIREMKIEPGIETPQVKSEDGELREPGPINPDGRIKQEGESQEERQKRFAAKRAEMKQKKLESYDYVVSCEPGAHKAGLTGEGIKLISNYVRIQQRGQWTLYHYHVSFNPPIERTVDKKAVMRPFAGGVKLGAYIFDGQSFWTAKRVAEDPAEVIKLDGALKDGTPVGIEVKLVAQLLPGDIMYLQFYSIMVRKCLSALKLDQMGRHFFDNTAAISMPNHKLELWPGFITTIRRHDAGLLYGVEITHKVIRLDNVFQVMTEIRKGVMRNREFTLAMVKEAVSAELVGTIVMTSYNRRTYRVDDIAFDETPKSTFPRENGGEVSYVDYFRERYQINIQSLSQPLLISNPKKKDFHRGHKTPYKLVPELCQMTGLNDTMRQNFSLMRDMGQHLFQPPQKKADTITKFIQRLRSTTQVREEMHSWGLNLTQDLVSLPGRCIPREGIIFGGRNGEQATFNVNEKGDFTQAFRSHQMATNVSLLKWVIIVPQRDAPNIDNLLSTMNRVARPLGFEIAPPMEVIRLHNNNSSGYVDAITEVANRYKRELQMVLTILISNKLDTYAAIKKRCYVDYGLLSQCFLAKNVTSKGLMSIATKLVVQMNAKLGGEPWNINLPLKALMVVGFDVHHGGKGPRTPSIGAMVATTSENYGRFYSTVSFFASREELSSNMASDLAKCVHAFRNMNQERLPNRIIFYRDGVGEGQLHFVFNTELEAIKVQLKEIYEAVGKEPPMLTFIVVTKRINTRFFQEGRCGYQNPAPGTVVDSTVTLPERWDFFLIAAQARQGVVSPTNYNVLWERNRLDADKLQRLSFKLCHLYYNWSGTVAVPAVCQYAHKLAFLTGLATKAPPRPNLCNRLYFL